MAHTLDMGKISAIINFSRTVDASSKPTEMELSRAVETAQNDRECLDRILEIISKAEKRFRQKYKETAKAVTPIDY